MILIANWKMQLGIAESEAAAKAVKAGLPKNPGAEVVIAPSFPTIASVAKILGKSGIALGAQDCFWQNRGPFTGEVSPASLKELGCRYVIVGHSERRAMGEQYALIAQKLNAVLGEGMAPILCVGESAEERRMGRVHAVLSEELHTALAGVTLTGNTRLIIAYEPIWAIGTGEAATASDAAGALATIKMILQEVMKPSDREKTQLIYGGSADHTNIVNFIRAEFDGSLVGGASLRAPEFIAMVKEAVAAV